MVLHTLQAQYRYLGTHKQQIWGTLEGHWLHICSSPVSHMATLRIGLYQTRYGRVRKAFLSSGFFPSMVALQGGL